MYPDHFSPKVIGVASGMCVRPIFTTSFPRVKQPSTPTR
jgi:hypothetical protein